MHRDSVWAFGSICHTLALNELCDWHRVYISNAITTKALTRSFERFIWGSGRAITNIMA